MDWTKGDTFNTNDLYVSSASSSQRGSQIEIEGPEKIQGGLAEWHDGVIVLSIDSVTNANNNIISSNSGQQAGERLDQDGRIELMDLVENIGHSSKIVSLSDNNFLARSEGLDKDSSSRIS